MDEISKNYIFKIIKKYGQKKNDYWYLNYKEKSYLKVSIIDLCDLNIDGVKIINDGFTFKMFNDYDICIMAYELHNIYNENIFE